MSTSTPKPTIAVISIGQMGLGIASLLLATGYRVITNVSDRSTATQDRARNANIECLSSDVDLVQQADYILSIVPPRDAIAMAQRIETAFRSTQQSNSNKVLYYLDLNAISPTTARQIESIFTPLRPTILFIDGGIIGGPPSLSRLTSPDSTPSLEKWAKPGIPISGPDSIPDTELISVLNMRFINEKIGSASGLKCCFAALSKGFTALALQSFSTASSLGVYAHLQDYLEENNPGAGEKARKTVVGCTTKAYRWVEEMRQIGETFDVEGGWQGRAQVFREIAGVFEGLADVVEREGAKKLGDAEGVVTGLGEGLRKTR
ncbi:6-phosphogluconate dehydrogenase [Paraphoma chrysanthemicola]|nr:6-phosphogluconate dehydrogenase [Paraphoma chrysanthemicola]